LATQQRVEDDEANASSSLVLVTSVAEVPFAVVERVVRHDGEVSDPSTHSSTR
jgi:hypothetical protein